MLRDKLIRRTRSRFSHTVKIQPGVTHRSKGWAARSTPAFRWPTKEKCQQNKKRLAINVIKREACVEIDAQALSELIHHVGVVGWIDGNMVARLVPVNSNSRYCFARTAEWRVALSRHNACTSRRTLSLHRRYRIQCASTIGHHLCAAPCSLWLEPGTGSSHRKACRHLNVNKECALCVLVLKMLRSHHELATYNNFLFKQIKCFKKVYNLWCTNRSLHTLHR